MLGIMKTTFPPTHVAAAALAGSAALSVLAVVAAFYWTFHGYSVQEDAEAWAFFGSYVGGLLGPVLGLLNLAALLLIALSITDQQQKSLASKRLSVDLLNEWHAQPLHESRIVVSEHIWNVRNGFHQPLTLSNIERDDSRLNVHAFRIYHFFERWAVLAKLDEVDSKILAEALGGRALWFRTNLFSWLRENETDVHIRKSLDMIEANVFSKLPRDAT